MGKLRGLPRHKSIIQAEQGATLLEYIILSCCCCWFTIAAVAVVGHNNETTFYRVAYSMSGEGGGSDTSMNGSECEDPNSGCVGGVGVPD